MRGWIGRRALSAAALLMGVSSVTSVWAQEATEGEAEAPPVEVIQEDEGGVQLPPITVEAPSESSAPTRARRRPAPDAAAVQAEPVPVAEPAAPFTPSPAQKRAVQPPIDAVTPAEIERSPAQSFGDLFFDKPGATSTSFAPGASRPVLRGLDGHRVDIQENGLGIGDVSALGGDHAVPIDPLAADRVEIVRGPESLRYTSGSVGGVVNAINGRIPVDIAPGTTRLEVQGAGTTVDDGFDGAVQFENRTGNVAVHVDAYGRNAEDYDTPLGIQDNSFVETEGQSAGATLFFDRGFFGTSVSRFASDYGIPGGEEAELGIHIDMEQVRWTNRGAYLPLNGPVSEVRFWLGYSDYDHDEIGQEHDHEEEHAGEDDHEHEEEHAEEHDHGPEDEGEVVHGTFAQKTWEARAEFQQRTVTTSVGALNGLLGFSWSHNDLHTEGEAEEFLAPNTTQDVATYLFEELELSDHLRLQGAARLEHRQIDGYAPEVPADLLPPPDEIATVAAGRDFTPFSASIGLERDLPRAMVLRADAEYSERAPTAAELFSKGPHHASGTFDIGDPGLGIETAKSVEIGIARDVGRFRFDAGAYHTDFDGFIFQELTGITCNEEFESCGIEDGEFDQVLTGQQDATFTGAELQGAYDVTEIAGGIFGVTGRYDFVHAKFADGTYVPRIPPHRLGGGVYWQDAHWLARVNLLHAFEQDEVAANEYETPAYDLLNASLSWSGALGDAKFGESLTLGIAADNLLDDEIRNAASFKADEVLLPGRSFKLFAKAVF
ncbi:TonB-dependent receptor [Methyloligella solikamskensis]|uniref:TonB-dependent receptor domain-containing protein n=1 Tax=Methyloligella solikamskensis TaxID=1177756 RepID=A0ABW3J9N9_9HYPH